MRLSPHIDIRRFEALGTTCELFAAGRAAALADAELWIRSIDRRLTRFSRDSELSAFNSQAGRWAEVSSELESLLRESLRAYETSLGLVNAAVLPRMLAIGYRESMRRAAPRATSGLEPAPLAPLSDVLRVRRGEAWLARGAALDLGGIAKGWIADRVCAMFMRNGIANLGGDLMAVGAGPDGAGWSVGVGAATVTLRDQAAATSSVRRRRWGAMHHLIDPRTGLPSQTGVDEASVVAATAVDAEVAAKTALLLGWEMAPEWCRRHTLGHRLVLTYDG